MPLRFQPLVSVCRDKLISKRQWRLATDAPSQPRASKSWCVGPFARLGQGRRLAACRLQLGAHDLRS